MSRHSRRALEAALTAAVVAVAALWTAGMWTAAIARNDALWQGYYHDRHGHFSFGLNLAIAIQSLDPIAFLSDLEKAKVWPPVHGLVLSVVLLFGDLDHRLGIVPSLAGWTLTVVCVWLIARRLFSELSRSLLAGVIAVSFALVSPAFRSIASDVMLEGLGTGLSALAILLFMRAWGRLDTRVWRPFAATLTVLFFEKGNYWALVAVSAVVTWFLIDHERVLSQLRQLRLFGMRHLWRDPLTVGAIVLAAAVLVILMRGPTTVTIADRRVSLYPPRNLLTLAYGLIFMRAFLEWRRHGQAITVALGVPGRALFFWHVIPVAVSFLLPQRLATFLWFVSPLNAPSRTFDPAGAVATYWAAFADAFHVAPWVAVVVIALFAVTAARLRALLPEGRLIVIFGMISAAAAIIHPARNDRYLTTFVFAYWIGAAAGLVLLIGSPAAGTRHWRLACATIAAAVLVAWQLFAHLTRLSAEAALAQQRLATPSDLELVATYAPFVEGRSAVGIASTAGTSPLLEWPLRERCHCRMNIDTFAPTADSRNRVRALSANWLAQTQVERLVILDLPHFRESLPARGWTYDRMEGIVDAVQQSDRFARVADVPAPAFGGRILILDRR